MTGVYRRKWKLVRKMFKVPNGGHFWERGQEDDWPQVKTGNRTWIDEGYQGANRDMPEQHTEANTAMECTMTPYQWIHGQQ